MKHNFENLQRKAHCKFIHKYCTVNAFNNGKLSHFGVLIPNSSSMLVVR